MKFTLLLVSTIALLLTASAGFGATDQRFWQLTMSYDQSGLRIIEAGQIPVTAKAIRTPGLESAPIRVAYNIDWLDAGGSSIVSTTTELPVGFRSAPDENGGPCRMIVPPTGIIVLRLAGPRLATQPASIRFSRSSTSLSKMLPQGIPPAVDFDSRVIPIESLAQTAVHRDGPLSGTKLRDTGPDGNRLVFVVLGDGYTQANLDAGLFTNAANNFVSAFDGRSPWDILFSGTNVYRIDVASNQSGSDNDPLGTLKDTYFNSSYWNSGIERALEIDNVGYARAVNAANAYVGYGVWDYLFVIVNDTKYGGTGGEISVISVHPSAREVALHETGHTFAQLADEYSDAYPGFPPGDGEPNVDYDYSGPGLKWLIWVNPETPLPTPYSFQYSDGTIGAFEGARYKTTGIYRPSYNCLMRALGVELDAVCKEAHVHQYTTMIDLLDAMTPPASSTVILPPVSGTTLAVKPIPIGPMTYQWKLGDSILTTAVDSSVSLNTGEFYAAGKKSSATLQLTVTFPTSLMRQYTAQRVVSWTLYPDCNGNGIADSLDIKAGTSIDLNHNGIPDECDAALCCVGSRGNVDGFGIVDLSDLAGLVSYLTGGGFQLACEREANVNGLGIVDLSDLSLLINYLTAGGLTLPNCP